jgi:type IV pilus assembly protein PilC
MINFNTQIILSKNVSSNDIILFTRHLSTMIKAGIPIVDALSALEQQTKQPYFKEVIQSVVSNLENGTSLAESFKAFPKVFSPFYVSLIEISEKSGTLEENLHFISKQLTKNARLQGKIKNALLYPGLVVISAVVMSIFITMFILPQLVGFFSVMDTDLPTSTKILIAIATISENYGVFIFGGLTAFMISFIAFIKVPVITPYWHGLLLRLPFLGSFFMISQIAHCCRNLGILLKSGIPITQTAEITAQTLTNVLYQQAFISIAKQISSGKNMADAMEKEYTHLFPGLVIKMVAVGEKTGKLDESLLYLGDFYEEEIDSVTKNLTTILEPILLIVIGLVVGFVALAIITPIYELSGSIRS